MASNPAEAALTSTAAHQIAPDLFPPRKSITQDQVNAAIEKCLEVQRRAVTLGKRPFAAVLLGPDNETVLLSHQSVDQVNHAEVSLGGMKKDGRSEEELGMRGEEWWETLS